MMDSPQAFAEEVAAEIGASPEPAPEPEAPASPEPVVAEAAPAPTLEPPRPAERTIPLATHIAERQRMQRELADMRAEMAKFTAAQAPKPVPPPDPATRPLEYIAWQEEQRKAQTAEHETKAEAEKRVKQEEEQREAIIDYYDEAADLAREAVPDWDDAYAHLTKWGEQTLRDQGIRSSRQRAKILANEEYKLVDDAIKRGLNPAAVIYQKAFDHGYQGRQQAPAPQPAPIVQQQPALAPTPPRDPATGQFQPAASAPTRQAPKSLSSVPGVPGGQLDGSSLANMDTADFDRMFLSGDREAWRNMHKRK